MAAAQVLPTTPLQGPVGVDILAVLPRPRRLCRRKDPDGLIWAPRRPDSDNIRKAVLDALKRHWADDGQVVDGATRKVYAERDGLPRLEVRVWLIEGLPEQSLRE